MLKSIGCVEIHGLYFFANFTKVIFFSVITMRYHTEKPYLYMSMYGITYKCDHPVYDSCTLYLIGNKGLAVIQQRFENKRTYWTEIDPWLTDLIYTNSRFKVIFDQKAGEKDEKGLYPTVSVRQLMWALKMKPIQRERWECVFDRKFV